MPLALILQILLCSLYSHIPISSSLLLKAPEKKYLRVTIYTRAQRCLYCCDDCEVRGRTEPELHSNPQSILAAPNLSDLESNWAAETTIACTLDNYQIGPIFLFSIPLNVNESHALISKALREKLKESEQQLASRHRKT